MKDIIKIDSNLPSDFLRIELFLSNICNYKCWYCFPGCNEGTHRWPKLESILDNLDHLINYYKEHLNKKIIYIHIIGGEPTLWKNFGEFVKYLKETHNCQLSISTNGSRTLRWWDKFGHYIDHTMISCHHEQVNVDHVIDVADMLYDKGISVNGMVLMDPTEWDKCISILENLKKSKGQWPITALEVFHETIKYNDDQRKYLITASKRHVNETYWKKANKITRSLSTITFSDRTMETVSQNWLSLNQKNYFTGWKCNIGIDTFFIEKNGFIQGACGEILYNLDFKYNIFDEDFKDKFKPKLSPVICTKNLCTCQPEINTTKEKIF